MKGTAISVDGGAELAKKAFNNDENVVKAIRSILEGCTSVSGGDRDDFTIKVLECAQKAATAVGVSFFDAFRAMHQSF